jgi:hypothetical protein
MKIAVKDLRANPFRHLERYPINREKVDALKKSIKDTEFWDNLLVRKSPDGNGYEMAYGHHRLVALKEMRVQEIDAPVRKLDDTQMAKIMAHENMEEWAWSASIEQETVRAIVEGFAQGRIHMPKVKIDGNRVRYAPSFQSGGGANSGRPELGYSAASLTEFLGWKESKVEATLNALSVVEKGLVKEKDFDGLTAYQAEAVARQVRRVEKETGKAGLAKKVGVTLSRGMRSATGRPGRGGKVEGRVQAVTLHSARHVTDQMVAKERRETAPKVYPPAGKAIPDLAMKLYDIPSPAMVEKFEAVIEVRKELHVKDVKMLAGALRGIAKRCTKFADRLEDL